MGGKMRNANRKEERVLGGGKEEDGLKKRLNKGNSGGF